MGFWVLAKLVLREIFSKPLSAVWCAAPSMPRAVPVFPKGTHLGPQISPSLPSPSQSLHALSRLVQELWQRSACCRHENGMSHGFIESLRRAPAVILPGDFAYLPAIPVSHTAVNTDLTTSIQQGCCAYADAACRDWPPTSCQREAASPLLTPECICRSAHTLQ